MKRAFLIFWKSYRSAVIKLLAIAVIVLFYRCPAKEIFGIDCPGCGLTRACLSALRFDLKAAFEYHPLFWLFGAGLFYLVFYEQIKRRFKISGRVELSVLLISAKSFLTYSPSAALAVKVVAGSNVQIRHNAKTNDKTFFIVFLPHKNFLIEKDNFSQIKIQFHFIPKFTRCQGTI